MLRNVAHSTGGTKLCVGTWETRNTHHLAAVVLRAHGGFPGSSFGFGVGFETHFQGYAVVFRQVQGGLQRHTPGAREPAALRPAFARPNKALAPRQIGPDRATAHPAHHDVVHSFERRRRRRGRTRAPAREPEEVETHPARGGHGRGMHGRGGRGGAPRKPTQGVTRGRDAADRDDAGGRAPRRNAPCAPREGARTPKARGAVADAMCLERASTSVER